MQSEGTSDALLDKWMLYLLESHDVETVKDLVVGLRSQTHRNYRPNKVAQLTSRFSSAIKQILSAHGVTSDSENESHEAPGGFGSAGGGSGTSSSDMGGTAHGQMQSSFSTWQ
jgi:hypothetical protein